MRWICLLVALLLLVPVSGGEQVAWSWIRLEKVKVDEGLTVLGGRDLGVAVDLPPSMVPPKEFLITSDARNRDLELVVKQMDGTSTVYSEESFSSGTLRLSNSRKNPIISMAFTAETVKTRGKEKIEFFKLLGDYGHEQRTLVNIPIYVASKQNVRIEGLKRENRLLKLGLGILVIALLATAALLRSSRKPSGWSRGFKRGSWKQPRRRRWF